MHPTWSRHAGRAGARSPREAPPLGEVLQALPAQPRAPRKPRCPAGTTGAPPRPGGRLRPDPWKAWSQRPPPKGTWPNLGATRFPLGSGTPCTDLGPGGSSAGQHSGGHRGFLAPCPLTLPSLLGASHFLSCAQWVQCTPPETLGAPHAGPPPSVGLWSGPHRGVTLLVRWALGGPGPEAALPGNCPTRDSPVSAPGGPGPACRKPLR